jgi:hypothetical protein
MGILRRTLHVVKRQIIIFDWTKPTKSLIRTLRFLYTRSVRLYTLNRNKDKTTVGDIEILVLGGLGDSIIATRFICVLAQNLLSSTRIVLYSSNPSILKWLTELNISQELIYLDEWQLPKRNNVPRLQIGHEVKFYKEVIDDFPKLLRQSEWKNEFTPSILNLEANERFNPVLGREIAQTAVLSGSNRCNFIFVQTGLKYAGNEIKLRYETFSKFHLPEKFITIHNGYDKNFELINPTSTKNYEHFKNVVDFIQQELNIPVVQLGIPKTSTSLNSEFNLIGKTTIQQTAGILGESLLHIDVESGLVHLATSLGTRCLVLFGPTPKQYFGYEENINISLENCPPCWWIKDNWMDKCHIKTFQHKCLDLLPPGVILEEIRKLLSSTG